MDDKIIAVASEDMSVNHINDISQLPGHFFKELKNFFEDYKKLENKKVLVEDFQNAQVAKEVIEKSIVDYKSYVAERKRKPAPGQPEDGEPHHRSNPPILEKQFLEALVEQGELDTYGCGAEEFGV